MKPIAKKRFAAIAFVAFVTLPACTKQEGEQLVGALNAFNQGYADG